MKPVHVFLVGNPAAGKSTIFQALTGQTAPARAKTSTSASFQQNGRVVYVEDFPGIYSLAVATPTERWVREQLITRKPDLIMNVVDATNLERDLYLTVQLTELGLPMWVILSKEDAAQAQGLSIVAETLSRQLHDVPVWSSQVGPAMADHPLKQALAAHFANGANQR